MSFLDIYNKQDFHSVALSISGEEAYGFGITPPPQGSESPLTRLGEFSSRDVEAALSAEPGQLSGRQLMSLLSPVADEYLEDMARIARDVTRKRFGNVILLYAPLYLSNECRSGCTYCGFSNENDIERVTLSIEEAVKDSSVLYERGIRHILLLTGEDLKNAPVSYIGEVSSKLSQKFPGIGIEVYPLKEDEYSILRRKGVDSLTLYQETYDPHAYKTHHLRGMKTRMEYRLDAPDRAGRAGFRKIGIGSLLGLSDPAAEMFFTAIHAKYLMKHYWRTQVLIGFPRLRPASGLGNVPVLPDRMFVRFMNAMRIFLPDAGLVLSTRESRRMRDNMAGICITQMSAASRTDPGGYGSEPASDDTPAGEQFHVEDDRSVEEITAMLEARGLEPVFVDWSSLMK